MHSNFGLQAGRRSPKVKVAVLDTIHGGKTIAELMARCGIAAEAFEVYHHTPSIAGFDLVVAPVHLPPGNPVLSEARRLGKRAITHHRAVGELLGQELETVNSASAPVPASASDKIQASTHDLKVFEVTGTYSKTTTALLLSKMLSARGRVVSHTTRGIELWSDGSGSGRLVRSGLSITPGNVIPALSEALSLKADALVSEISLGGTGLADFGVLTSFSGDYMIAGRTRWASTAKLQMVSFAKKGFRLVANTDVRISPDVSFGPGGQVWALPGRLRLKEEDYTIRPGVDLDFPSYQTAIAAAAAAAHASGIDAQEITSALEGFDGFTGRMKVDRRDGLTVFDCSNSGLKVSDVKRAMDNANASGGRLGLVVGEDAKTVCEGMDIPGLVELLRLRRGEICSLVLVGERLQPWSEGLEAKVARDLADGREMALDQGANVDRLLLCVKCFR